LIAFSARHLIPVTTGMLASICPTKGKLDLANKQAPIRIKIETPQQFRVRSHSEGVNGDIHATPAIGRRIGWRFAPSRSWPRIGWQFAPPPNWPSFSAPERESDVLLLVRTKGTRQHCSPCTANLFFCPSAAHHSTLLLFFSAPF
jgi:hypothetical protein